MCQGSSVLCVSRGARGGGEALNQLFPDCSRRRSVAASGWQGHSALLKAVIRASRPAPAVGWAGQLRRRGGFDPRLRPSFRTPGCRRRLSPRILQRLNARALFPALPRRTEPARPALLGRLPSAGSSRGCPGPPGRGGGPGDGGRGTVPAAAQRDGGGAVPRCRAGRRGEWGRGRPGAVRQRPALTLRPRRLVSCRRTGAAPPSWRAWASASGRGSSRGESPPGPGSRCWFLGLLPRR